MTGTLTIADVEGGVPAAVARVEAALDRLGVTVFARIDHAAAARAVGLELPDEVVLVFGDPAVGTAPASETRPRGSAVTRRASPR